MFFRNIMLFGFLFTAACGHVRHWQPVEGLGHPPGIDYQAQTCEQRLAQRMRIYADMGQDGNCRIQDRTWNQGFSWVQVRACDVTCNPRPLPQSVQTSASYSRPTGPSDAELRQRQADRVMTREEVQNLQIVVDTTRRLTELESEKRVAEEHAEVLEERLRLREEREEAERRAPAPAAERQAPPRAPSQSRKPESSQQSRVTSTRPSFSESFSRAMGAVQGLVSRITSVDCEYYRIEWEKIEDRYGCGLQNENRDRCTLERGVWSRYIKECDK